MNKARRARLQEAIDLIEQAKDIMSEVKDEEEEAYDSMPESFQDSDRGESMRENIDTLGGAIDEADDLQKNLIDVVEG